MRYIWNYVNALHVKRILKNCIYVICLTVLSAIIGAVAWLIARNLGFSGIDWLLCFVGYPATIGYFGGILYLYNHEFV